MLPTAAAVDWTAARRRQRVAAEARAREPHQSPFLANASHAFGTLFADRPDWERQALTTAYAIANEPVYLFDEDLLVGTTYQRCPGSGCPQLAGGEAWAGRTVGELARELVAARVPGHDRLVDPTLGGRVAADGAAPGHIAWQWEVLLAEGIEGLLARCGERLVASAADEPAQQFLTAVCLVWAGVIEWHGRHVAALEERLATAPAAQQAHWSRLLAAFRHAPLRGARDFREAVACYHFQHLAVMLENPFGGNGPGLLDRGLGPYLDRDLAAGAIELDEAAALVEGLLLKFHERLYPHDGWVETAMVGGLDEAGEWAGNTLSELLLEIFIGLRQTHPAVYVRLAEAAPARFVDLAVRYYLEGGNRAQLVNDDAVVPMLVETTGLAPADAARYMCGGCMELAPHGLNSDLNFTHWHNVAKTAELVLTGGVCLVTGQRRFDLPGDLTSHATFESLYAAFEAELARELDLIFRRLDCWSEAYAARRPSYLISSLVGDCLSRGRGLQDGGARYHDYGAAPLGVINAADALHAVDVAVYQRGLCEAADLLAALRADFAGQEPLRRELLAIPKFGSEDPAADRMAQRVLGSLAAIYAGYRNRFGGRIKPMVFNFVWTPEASRALGASPDGRRAGELIGHGVTPQPLGLRKGLSAAINSVGTLPLHQVAGGTTTMWDLDPEVASPALAKAVIRSFMAQGGQIFQGNTTSVAELEQALERPDDFPHLMVRVGGFSARFAGLDPAVQREIVTRYRHRGA